MIVNEILAPHYVKVGYKTPFAQHNCKFYFATGSEVSEGIGQYPNDWRVRGAGFSDWVSISEVVDNVFLRATNQVPATTRINKIELFSAASGANQFVTNILLPSLAVGAGAGKASAYTMSVYGSSTRQKFRLSLYDGAEIEPQRYAAITPASNDDGTLHWYILNSGVPFATQDGLRLISANTVNTGYNRMLAKRYGRDR